MVLSAGAVAQRRVIVCTPNLGKGPAKGVILPLYMRAIPLKPPPDIVEEGETVFGCVAPVPYSR